MVPKRRYPALNRVSVGRKLKGEISKRRMTQNVVENCWKTAVRWLASGRNERVFALLLRYNLTLHHHGGTSGMDIIQSGGGRSILPGTPPCSATPMSSISRSRMHLYASSPVVTLQWQTSGSTSPISWDVSRSFVPSISSDREK